MAFCVAFSIHFNFQTLTSPAQPGNLAGVWLMFILVEKRLKNAILVCRIWGTESPNWASWWSSRSLPKKRTTVRHLPTTLSAFVADSVHHKISFELMNRCRSEKTSDDFKRPSDAWAEKMTIWLCDHNDIDMTIWVLFLRPPHIHAYVGSLGWSFAKSLAGYFIFCVCDNDGGNCLAFVSCFLFSIFRLLVLDGFDDSSLTKHDFGFLFCFWDNYLKQRLCHWPRFCLVLIFKNVSVKVRRSDNNENLPYLLMQQLHVTSTMFLTPL